MKYPSAWAAFLDWPGPRAIVHLAASVLLVLAGAISYVATVQSHATIRQIQRRTFAV